MTQHSAYSCNSPGCLAFAAPSGTAVLPDGWRATGGGLHLCPTCQDRPIPRSVPVDAATGRSHARIILRTVAAYYHLEVPDLTGRQRTKHFLWPRKLACYLIRTETPLSLPAIGRVMGGRDHSTVLSAVRLVEGRLGEAAVAEAHAEIRSKYREESRRLPN